MDWLILALVVIPLPFVIPRIMRVWRNERPPDPFTPASTWGFGGPLWRGGIRAGTCSLVLVSLVIPLVLSNTVLSGSFAGAVRSVTLILAVPTCALTLAIIFWNRPSRLVPPHLRGQPGALAEWDGEQFTWVPPADGEG